MNAEIKAKWLEALRSGKYRQGKGFLHAMDKFCCLGVLCDLHAKETGEQWVAIKTPNAVKAYMGELNYLPEDIKEWAELASNNPEVLTKNLSTYNDQGKSFTEIANIIEREL